MRNNQYSCFEEIAERCFSPNDSSLRFNAMSETPMHLCGLTGVCSSCLFLTIADGEFPT